MFIQRCKNCSKQFKWLTVIKSIWNGYKPIECDNCKTKHYFKFSSRILIAILIPLPVFFQRTLFNLFSSDSIFIYPIWIILVICLSPFFARYFIR
jgi:CXXC-20-CXXC protein